MFQNIDSTRPSLTALPAGDTLALFRRVYDDSLDAALLIGPAGELRAANREACTLFGATEDALCAASRAGAQALLVDTDDPRSERLRAESLATGRARGGLRLRRMDSRLFEADVASFLFLDSGGHPSSVMTVRDLSALQISKRLIQESEERLGFALDAAEIGDWDMDLRTNVARRSLRHDQCFGYAQVVPEWGYDTFISHVHAEDRERVDSCYRNAMAKAPGGDYDVEFRVLWPDGSLHWLWSKGRFYFDETGVPYRVAGIQVDITLRHRVEEQLRRSEQDLAVTLQSIGDAVMATDVEGRITRMNAAAEQLTGWSLAEAQLQPLGEVFQTVDVDTRRNLVDPVEQVLQTGKVVARHNHTTLLAREGSEHQISTNAAPIRDVGGHTVGVVLVFSDVTEAYQARQALASAADSLERTSAMARIGGWELEVRTMQPYWSPETFRIHEVDPPVTPPLGEAIAFYPPESRAQIQPALQAAMEHGTPWDLELPLVTATGRHIWVRTQCSAVLEGSKVVRLRGAFHDITERKLAEVALRNSTDFNVSVLDSLSEQIAVLDADGVIVAVNAAWRRRAILGGAESEEDLGVGMNYLHVYSQALGSPADEDADKSLAGIRSVLRREVPEFHLEYRCQSPTEQRWFRVSVVPMQGASRGAVVSHTDISERKQAEENTHRLAYFDALTGLPNRRLLVDRIEQALCAAQRGGQVGAILFIDLDNFKQINDARGHSMGDRLLVQVARRLSQQLRGDDSVARLGGDEFVVLIGQLGHDLEAGARHARAVADKVREVLEQPYDINGTLYASSGSIGITLFPKADEGVDDLLREADTAMYRAKSAGRNRIAFFEPEMQAEVEDRLALEQDLKEAVGSDQISVHVQPQFDADGAEVGGELLLRWWHPKRGNVSPAQFIPIAEDTGLILPMGEFVIRQACEALVQMLAVGRVLPLSVNVSPRQFRRDDFVEQVRAVLANTGAPASALVFEVTEGLLIDDWTGAQARMSELVQLGIRFSIDDFGTGYSSLAYLRKLPLFELKIDRSFVRDIPNDPGDTSIVETILSMARNLKLRVVAEGVETREQADFLVAAGCPVLQGFLFARPQPLTDWLAQRLTPSVED